MLFGTKQQLAKITSKQINIGDNQIKMVDHVRNLGGWLDSNLSMHFYVNQVCKKVNHNLYNLRRVRKYLNQKACETFFNGTVSLLKASNVNST